MWIVCDKCGKEREIKLRKEEVWMVQWQCGCGYKNYKQPNLNTPVPHMRQKGG